MSFVSVPSEARARRPADGYGVQPIEHRFQAVPVFDSPVNVRPRVKRTHRRDDGDVQILWLGGPEHGPLSQNKAAKGTASHGRDAADDDAPEKVHPAAARRPQGTRYFILIVILCEVNHVIFLT